MAVAGLDVASLVGANVRFQEQLVTLLRDGVVRAIQMTVAMARTIQTASQLWNRVILPLAQAPLGSSGFGEAARVGGGKTQYHRGGRSGRSAA